MGWGRSRKVQWKAIPSLLFAFNKLLFTIQEQELFVCPAADRTKYRDTLPNNMQGVRDFRRHRPKRDVCIKSLPPLLRESCRRGVRKIEEDTRETTPSKLLRSIHIWTHRPEAACTGPAWVCTRTGSRRNAKQTDVLKVSPESTSN